jgi:hypothetical protein
MRRERVVELDVFGALYIGSLRHVVKECPAFCQFYARRKVSIEGGRSAAGGAGELTVAWCAYRHQHIVIEA